MRNTGGCFGYTTRQFLTCCRPPSASPPSQLGTHLRAKNKREEMGAALRKMR